MCFSPRQKHQKTFLKLYKGQRKPRLLLTNLVKVFFKDILVDSGDNYIFWEEVL